jgi:hypothetical protein
LPDSLLSVVCVAGLALSDLVPPDNAAWAACARAGMIAMGVSNTSAVTAGKASHVVLKKGR